MDASEDTVEVPISSLLVDSLKSNQSRDDLSPEEIAWVDSCLVKDPDISDSDWSSMKDALIEILGLQPESVASHESTAPATNGFSGDSDIEMIHSAEPGRVKSSRMNDDDYSISAQINDKEMETTNDDFSVKEEADSSLSRNFQGALSDASLRNAFLPHYREDNKKVGEPINSGGDIIGSSTYEIGPLTEDIFKVWDLGIAADEEDELVKQLNKALAESPDQLMSSITDDSRAWKDLKEQSLDDLISGIADLSLNQQSD